MVSRELSFAGGGYRKSVRADGACAPSSYPTVTSAPPPYGVTIGFIDGRGAAGCISRAQGQVSWGARGRSGIEMTPQDRRGISEHRFRVWSAGGAASWLEVCEEAHFFFLTKKDFYTLIVESCVKWIKVNALSIQTFST